MQQSAFAYLEQALWRVEGERAKARSGARSENDGFHLLEAVLDGVNHGLYLLTTSEGDAQAVFQTFVGHELNLVVLRGKGLLQLFLDGSRIFDENEVGNALVNLEAGFVAQF